MCLVPLSPTSSLLIEYNAVPILASRSTASCFVYVGLFSVNCHCLLLSSRVLFCFASATTSASCRKPLLRFVFVFKSSFENTTDNMRLLLTLLRSHIVRRLLKYKRYFSYRQYYDIKQRSSFVVNLSRATILSSRRTLTSSSNETKPLRPLSCSAVVHGQRTLDTIGNTARARFGSSLKHRPRQTHILVERRSPYVLR